MNYNRNPVTGRLAPEPLQTPAKMGVVPEAPSIVYTAGTTFPKDPSAASSRGVPDFLLKKMKSFQAHNNIPIHLKGGPTDKVLLASTLVMCGLGLASCFQFFYDMSFPKKPAE